MNDTLAEMRATIQSDLNVSTNSSLYPPDTISNALRRAYIKCFRLFRWPGTEGAKKTVTAANRSYYDAPTDFVPDSIHRLTINGELYGETPDGTALTFSDFLNWKQENPTSTDKKWSRQWMRFFISPTPTVAGLEIAIWGQVNPTGLDGDTSTTIFTHYLPECNEAVIMEAEAILKAKGSDPKGTEFYSGQAKSILALTFTRIKQDGQFEEKIAPMLDVPDFFSPHASNTTIVGNFTRSF